MDIALPTTTKDDEQYELLEPQQKTSKLRWFIPVIGVICIIIGASLAGYSLSNDELDGDSSVLVVHNAIVYTVNAENPRVEAFAVRGGQFIELGNSSFLLEKYPDANKRDAQGNLIVPGLIDAHAHLMNLGLSKLGAELYECPSKEACVQILVNYYNNLNPPLDPETQWLLGRGWDQTYWPIDAFPTKEDLDTAFPDIPVWLTRVDGHAGWANSAAIRAVPALPDEDPQGGQIIRDTFGQPTGIFVDSAQRLISTYQPPFTTQQMKDATLMAIAECNSYGLTGVHEAGATPDYIAVYKNLIDEGKFSIRNYAMLSSCGTTYCGDGQRLENYGNKKGQGALLNVRSVKLYLDGALGSWGAAMIEPYSDNPNSTGLFMFNSTDDLDATVSVWAHNGWQVNSHAIGDRANNYIIDSLQKVMQDDEQLRELRHRIEHTQIILPSDVVRMGNLGIIPSMQPTHATSDMRWAPDRLGPDRLNEAYPWSTALEAAGVIPLGSDFPVEYVDPLLGFYAAITRQNASGWPEGGWLPDFCLTRPQTLKGFTWDAAFAAFQENEIGSIEVGKWADFVIIKGNIMDETAPPTDILNAQVLATYMAGAVVYERQD